MLPEINPTTPSAPPGFAVTQQINGTLLFEWTTPIIKPSGTRFQIIRSTNSGNAAVGTTVWEGDASPVPLVMPSSTHWYYARAIANSAFSPYTPNTFGIAGAARDESESARNAGPFKDWTFRLSKDFGSYWNTDATNVFSISPTGGVDGGRLIVVPRSAQLYSVLVRPFELLKARVVRTAIRIRCTSLGVGVNTQGTRPVFQVFGWDGISTPTQTNSNYLGGPGSTAFVQFAPVTANVGKWFEFASVGTLFTDQAGSIYADISSYPYIAGVLNSSEMGTTPASASGLFEIDFLDFRYL